MATDPDAALHGATPGKYRPGAPPPAVNDPGTLADTVERMPELAPVRPTAAPIEDPASFGEVYDASRATGRGDRSDFDEIMVRDGYQPIVAALGLADSENPSHFIEDRQAAATGGTEMFGNPSQLATRAGVGDTRFAGSMRRASRELQEQLIADEIKRHRAADPKFLPGVPDTPDALHKYFLESETAKRRTAQATLGRSQGLSGTIASLAGGVVEGFHDPLNLVTLPIGGGGKTILQTVARETLVNGALEAMQQPLVAQNRKEFGETLSLGEAVQNSVIAGVGGGVLEGGLKAAGKGLSALDARLGTSSALADKIYSAMPERLQKKWDRSIVNSWSTRLAAGEKLDDVFGELNNRELSAMSRAIVGEDKLTPDEQAAAHVLERAQDIGATSPYERTAAGDGRHEQGLAEALKALEDGVPPPDHVADAAAEAPTSVSAVRPPEGQSTARRPQKPAHLPAEIYQGLKARGIPDHIARGAAAGSYAEAADGARALNPTSGAMGIGQWLGPRKEELIRRYGPNPTLDQQLDFLVHELKGGDAGGAAVLGAKDETAALDAYIRKFMRPAAGAETTGDLERGMAALGRGGEAAPGGADQAGIAAAAGDDAAIARLRADATALDDQVVGLTRRPDGSTVIAGSRSVPSSKILVDAERFQFKSGGDQFGVSDRLKGVTEFDPILSGRVILWEGGDGRLFVADGHQRVGLAKRIASESGKDTAVDSIVLREADGVSAEDARVMAALKNMAEGTGSAVDAAKVLRDAPELADRLPPRSALVRDGAALSRLSDDAFGAVYNGVIAPDIAAVVGHLAGDRPELHAGLVELLVKLDPSSRGQADSIVRQAMEAGFHRETQDELFGAREMIQPLMLERAKVLEKGLAKIRKLGLVHRTAAREKVTLEATGSHIAAERSAREAQANDQAAEILQRLAFRNGPVAHALNAAARDLAEGGNAGSVVDRFIAAVRSLDLATLDRAAPIDDRGGLGLGGSGRGGDAGETLEAVRGEPEQPSLEDLQAATERFSDPDGKAVQQQAESLVHDFTAATTRREQIHAASAALEGTAPGEFRSVEPFPKDEPGYRRFRYVTADGKAVGGNYTIDGELIEGFNIGDTNAPVDLGPAELRQLFAQLHAEHPEVTLIHGYRMTGARAAAGDGPQEIWMKVTDKGLQLTEPPDPVALVDDFRAALEDERMSVPAEDLAHLSDREVADLFVEQVIGDVINDRAIRSGRELTLLQEDLRSNAADESGVAALQKELAELAMGALAGDTDKVAKLVNKAIDEGRLKLKDLGEPDRVGPNKSAMAPSETVLPPVNPKKSADYAGAFIPQEEATARVASWKAEAERIGRENPPPPGSVIISLFDASGRWSKPYRDMGYEVIQLDIKHGHDVLQNLGNYMLAIDQLKARGGRVAGVLAQPPCTTFAGSGARWWDPRHNRNWGNAVEKMWGTWATKFFSSPVEYNQFLVAASEQIIARADPEFFAMENPRGRIAKLNGLPKANLEIEPHHFGDAYTKNTFLYGKFNNELETANVSPAKEDGGKGSLAHELRSNAEKDGGLRSLTPEGFAYAFALANRPGTEEAARAVDAPDPGADNPLDLGELIDPNVAAKNRDLVELGGQAPQRGPQDVDQLGEIGLPLMDAADQLGIHLGDDSRALLDEIDGDEKALKSIKDCL